MTHRLVVIAYDSGWWTWWTGACLCAKKLDIQCMPDMKGKKEEKNSLLDSRDDLVNKAWTDY